MFCGPKENRTLHTFLAREHRQPWYMQAHKPVGREGFEPPYCESNTTIFAQGGFTVHCRYLPMFCTPNRIRTGISTLRGWPPEPVSKIGAYFKEPRLWRMNRTSVSMCLPTRRPAPLDDPQVLTVFGMSLTNPQVLGTGLEPAFTGLKGRLPQPVSRPQHIQYFNELAGNRGIEPLPHDRQSRILTIGPNARLWERRDSNPLTLNQYVTIKGNGFTDRRRYPPMYFK